MTDGSGYPPVPEPPLPVPVYDNHTHLEFDDRHDGRALPLSVAEHLDRAERAGIAGVVQVGTDVATSRWSAEAAARDIRLLAAVALHPNEAPELEASGDLDDALAAIDELAARPRVRAVGETGLDFYRTDEQGRPAQFRSFEAHIDIAKRHGLALQIHDRDAHDDVVATLRRVGAPERTVFHCFSGGDELARTAADAGWYCSFAGNVTFKNADNLREALRVLPRELIVVETDAPYLTPVPLRGRPNAPYLVPHTVRFMAELLGTDLAELCAQLASNTVRAYGSWQDEPVTTGGGS
ncbi:TatD family deoxyribonuclease [Agromyces intestinalis]|uniref:TatD family deoxyribonuclease n=1 Tax=Agromyces intestinalis TaxID=2592652 RepID=A0A5C1YKQ9_9MICO|nr:TatD family hydrolase [Agromyces intestinalis]QEO15392.1 TatD family deoxyribonuclease [Agromyces intestinalis]